MKVTESHLSVNRRLHSKSCNLTLSESQNIKERGREAKKMFQLIIKKRKGNRKDS